MIGTMIGTMKSTMMWGYFMDEPLQPLCGEALLGFNGAARVEEIYGCDWATLLPGHQGPAALPGRGHLPSCMRPDWPTLNEDHKSVTLEK